MGSKLPLAFAATVCFICLLVLSACDTQDPDLVKRLGGPDKVNELLNPPTTGGDGLSITGSDPAEARIDASATNVLVEVVEASVVGPAVTLNDMTLTASGTGDDLQALDLVQLYVDDDGNGQFDGTEPLLDSSQYSGDDGTVTLSVGRSISGSETYLVLYDFKDPAVATAGQVFSTSVTDATGSGGNIVIDPANEGSVEIGIGTLTFQVGAQTPATSGGIPFDAVDLVVLQAEVTNNGSEDASLSEIVIQDLGTVDPGAISRIRIIEDSNGSGTIPQNPNVLADELNGLDATREVRLTVDPAFNIQQGQSVAVLIVYDLNAPSSEADNTMQAAIPDDGLTAVGATSGLTFQLDPQPAADPDPKVLGNLLSLGPPSFATSPDLTVAAAANSSLQAMAIGDLDKDGIEDVVVGGSVNGLQVFLGREDSSGHRYDDVNAGTFNLSVRVDDATTLTDFPAQPPTPDGDAANTLSIQDTRALLLVDLDRDGDLDIVQGVQPIGLATDPGLLIWRNDTTRADLTQNPVVLRFTIKNSPSGTADGFMFGIPTGAPKADLPLGLFNEVRDLAASDLDRDGDLDIVSGNSSLRAIIESVDQPTGGYAFAGGASLTFTIQGISGTTGDLSLAGDGVAPVTAAEVANELETTFEAMLGPSPLRPLLAEATVFTNPSTGALAVRVTAVDLEVTGEVGGALGTLGFEDLQGTTTQLNVPVVRIDLPEPNLVWRNDTARDSRAGLTVGGATATTLSDGTLTEGDDFFNGAVIEVTSGAGAGQVREVTDWDNGTGVFTIDPAWTTIPSGGDTYAISHIRVAPDLAPPVENGLSLGGATTRAVAIGDLNRDGAPDIYAGNTTDLRSGTGPGNVLYLNDGSGHFPSQSDIVGGDETFDVAIRDMNGDGLLDLIDANQGTNRIWAFTPDIANPRIMIRALNDSFGTAATRRILLHDFDADGDPDVLSVNTGADGLIHFNDGTGVMTAGTLGGQDNIPTTDILSGVKLDRNRDGDPDLVAVEATQVVVLDGFNNQGTVTGFDETTLPITYDTEAGTLDSLGSETTDLALADVTFDGIPDLIQAGRGSGTPQISEGATDVAPAALVYEGTGGSFSTQATQILEEPDPNRDSNRDPPVTRPPNHTSIALPADLDGDGDQDVILGYPNLFPATYGGGLGPGSGTGEVRFLINEQNSRRASFPLSFGGPASAGIHFRLIGSLPTDGSESDLTSFTLVHEVFLNDQPEGVEGSEFGMNWNPVTSSGGLTGLPTGTNDLALGDLDGDGRRDLVIALQDGTLRVARGNSLIPDANNPAGFFTLLGTTFSPPAGVTTEIQALALADIDRDGDLDVLGAGDGPNLIFRNRSTTTAFTEVGAVSATSTTLTDGGRTEGNDFFNGLSLRITGGTGAGQIRTVTDYDGGTDTFTISPAWNTTPDGTSTYRVLQTTIRLSDSFQFGAKLTGIFGESARDSRSIVTEDFNRDGFPDIVVANASFTNNGNQLFTLHRSNLLAYSDSQRWYQHSDLALPSPVTVGSELESRGVAVADFDRNGTLDLVFANALNSPNELFTNDGSGVFTNSSALSSEFGTLSNASDSKAILVRDLNQDGFPDMVVTNQGGQFPSILHGR